MMDKARAASLAASLKDNEFFIDALARMRTDSLEKLAAIDFVAHPDTARDLQANVRVIDGFHTAIAMALTPAKKPTGLA